MLDNGDHLVLFPTVANRLDGTQTWQADIHGWCFTVDELRNFQRTTANLIRRSLKLPRDQPDPAYFRKRVQGFVVENVGKKNVLVSHPCGAQVTLRSKRNGHFRGSLTFDLDSVSDQDSEILHISPMLSSADPATSVHKTILSACRLDAQPSIYDSVENVGGRGDDSNGQTRSASPPVSSQGTVYLTESTGLSIVSDIDDTIKFTNVSNKSELLANTFLRPFRPIEGMPQLFQKLAGDRVNFHYISATPWQMYGSIATFLSEAGFPEGSIHLRKFTLKDATFLKKIFPAYKKKRKVLHQLLTRFPQRKFLLIGDTGERDPELYGDIARRFPDQIVGLCLRNTSPDAPDSLRFRRAFAYIPTSKWVVYEDSLRLEESFLAQRLSDLRI